MYIYHPGGIVVLYVFQVAESVWGVVSANLTFIGSMFGAVLGIILGFGLELLNLIIGVVRNWIVLFCFLQHKFMPGVYCRWFS